MLADLARRRNGARKRAGTTDWTRAQRTSAAQEQRNSKRARHRRGHPE
jgi:hypothetical protein